jgi:hypothetical protein
MTGEPVFYGSAVARGGSHGFELNAVASVGNPAAAVAGEFVDGRLSFAGVSSTSVGIGGGRSKNIPLLDETPEDVLQRSEHSRSPDFLAEPEDAGSA